LPFVLSSIFHCAPPVRISSSKFIPILAIIAFVNAPILAHYDPSLETWVETDASDFVVVGVLSQMHDGILKPVAYFSQKLIPAQCNYMIYDKELLTIIKSFET
jgi:hypothetical protein